MEKTSTSNSKERKVKCQLEQTEKHSSIETRLTFSRKCSTYNYPNKQIEEGFCYEVQNFIFIVILFYFFKKYGTVFHKKFTASFGIIEFHGFLTHRRQPISSLEYKIFYKVYYESIIIHRKRNQLFFSMVKRNQLCLRTKRNSFT